MHVTRTLAASALAGMALTASSLLWPPAPALRGRPCFAAAALPHSRRLEGTPAACPRASLAAAVPLAMADDMSDTGPSDIIVMPATAQRGETLTVTVDGTSCRGTGTTYDTIVESGAFARTPLKGMATQGVSYATPRVFTAAKPGAYDITATCAGKSVTGGRFTVVAGPGPGPGPGARARAGAAAKPTALTLPAKGATAVLGAAERSTDSTETALAVTALAAVVAAAGVYLIRRRAAGRR